MREDSVIKSLKKWLDKQYPSSNGFKVECKEGGKGEGLDCEVFRNGKLAVQIEAKGSSGDIYDGLGQCMWWYYEHELGVKTYLAVPSDCKACPIQEIGKVLDDNKAKFGLLEVKRDGEVKIVRDIKV
jgi:hypothetical protein